MARSGIIYCVSILVLALAAVSAQELKAGVIPCIGLDAQASKRPGKCHSCKHIICLGSCRDTPLGPVCTPPSSCPWAPCRKGFQCKNGKCVPVVKTCANIVCRPPNRCFETPTGPICKRICPRGVSQSPTGQCLYCDRIKCPQGTKCQETSTGSRCVKCQDIPCPENYSPVCASDGNTYGNDCLPKCLQLTYADGVCKQTCKDIVCPSGGCTDTLKGPICNIKDPCQLIDCAAGFRCVNGVCKKTCRDIVCPSGGCTDTPKGPICNIKDPCQLIDCAAGYRCVNGRCVWPCKGVKCPIDIVKRVN